MTSQITSNEFEKTFQEWLNANEAFYGQNLTFPEIRRALQALSTRYVQKRDKVHGHDKMGLGHQAAFCLFYGALHGLIVAETLGKLTPVLQLPSGAKILDLGCGNGICGAVWARLTPNPGPVHGIERQKWAVTATRQTYRQMGLKGLATTGCFLKSKWPKADAILAAWALNELNTSEREKVRSRMLLHQNQGGYLFVLEPISRAISPWWEKWGQPLLDQGANRGELKLNLSLPPLLAKLDKAAGMNHRQVKVRYLVAGNTRA